MCTGQTEFDVITGQLYNQCYLQGVYCMHYNTTNRVKTMVRNGKTMVCVVVINFPEKTLILQPEITFRVVTSKSVPARARGNRL